MSTRRTEPLAELSLRAAVVDDASAISALIHRFAAEFTIAPDGAGAERFFDSSSVSAEAGYIADPRYRYIVATEGGTLVACVALRDGSHLFHLFVDTRFQGRGLARQLWEAVTASAGEAEVFTVNSSPRALAVYERFGFAATGPLTQADGVCFIPMSCRPAAAGGG